MSLRLMKERMKISGHTPREEMIRDGQNLLKEELEHDSSYSPTMFFYDSVNKTDDRLANFRVYGRKYSSLNGNYMHFLTTYDNPVKIGDYIHDKKDDTYWLVYNSFNVNDIQYQGKLIQCNYLLKWQLSDGTVVERWANIVSASKYDIGEVGNNTIVLSSNNFTILIGFCEEGFELEEQRVFIDKRNVNPTKVFKITRGDDVLFDSGDMGSLMSFIADKVEFDRDKDRQDLKLCDYIDVEKSNSPTLPSIPSSPNQTFKTTILGRNSLTVGYSRKYTVKFTDNAGEEITGVNYSWNVKSNFANKIVSTQDGHSLTVTVNDRELIGNTFAIQVIKDSDLLSEITVIIEDTY